MLTVISYKNIGATPDLFFGQHRLRHKEFIDRQSYDVKTLDGMEFDEYDTLASAYLVYSEDGKNVLGCSRLTPVEYGSMLKDHFPSLVEDHSIFGRPDVWEGTRFCIDSTLPASKRLEILRLLSLGYLEFGLSRGAGKIIGLMPTLILRSVFERQGIVLDRLGIPHEIGRHSRIQAAAITISQEQLARGMERTGLRNVLGLMEQAEHRRAA